MSRTALSYLSLVSNLLGFIRFTRRFSVAHAFFHLRIMPSSSPGLRIYCLMVTPSAPLPETSMFSRRETRETRDRKFSTSLKCFRNFAKDLENNWRNLESMLLYQVNHLKNGWESPSTMSKKAKSFSSTMDEVLPECGMPPVPYRYHTVRQRPPQEANDAISLLKTLRSP